LNLNITKSEHQHIQHTRPSKKIRKYDQDQNKLEEAFLAGVQEILGRTQTTTQAESVEIMLKSSFLCVLVLALVSMPLALGFQRQNHHLRVLSTTTTRGINSMLPVGASQQPGRIRKTRGTQLFHPLPWIVAPFSC
jgi:hypothetical protein